MSARVEHVASAGINTWLIDDEVIVIDPGHDPASCSTRRATARSSP